eukprot:Rmarinus@m.29738
MLVSCIRGESSAPCTCGKGYEFGVPCEHVILALYHAQSENLAEASRLCPYNQERVHEVNLEETHRKLYAYVPPLLNKVRAIVPGEETRSPSRAPRSKGRPQRIRKEAWEVREKVERGQHAAGNGESRRSKQKCSRCGTITVPPHNRLTCRYEIEPRFNPPDFSGN